MRSNCALGSSTWKVPNWGLWNFLTLTLVLYLTRAPGALFNIKSPSPVLNLTHLAAFLRLFPSAARLAALGKKWKKGVRGVKLNSGLKESLHVFGFSYRTDDRILKHWSIYMQWGVGMCITSQITGFSIVWSTVYSGANQRKLQSSAPLAFVGGIHLTKGQKCGNYSIWWRHHVLLPITWRCW